MYILNERCSMSKVVLARCLFAKVQAEAVARWGSPLLLDT